MTKKEHEALKAVAEELNEVMGYTDDPLDIEMKAEGLLKEVIGSADADIDPNDKFTDETTKWLIKNTNAKVAKDELKETETTTEDEETEEMTEKKAPAKKKAAKKKAPVKKAAVKKTAVKTEKKGPGIIDEIYSQLKSASKKNPVTNAEITEHLASVFPDRNPEKMKKTVACQLTASRLPAAKEFTLGKERLEGGVVGYYISKK